MVFLNVIAIANIPRAVHQNSQSQAFLSSTVTIMCLVFLFGMALFPNLVAASNDAGKCFDSIQRRFEPRNASDNADHRDHRAYRSS